MRYCTLLPAFLLVAACARGGDGAVASPECRILQAGTPLEGELQETSGLAVSRRHPDVIWTHNDSGGEPDLMAVRPGGQLVGTVRVRGAENEDWEDIGAGPCPAGTCLYIGDIGDNQGERDEVVIYRVPEPDLGDRLSEPAERFPVRYPDGARDAEGLFVLPDGSLHIVTKGRNSSVAIYRYPGELTEGDPVELERVLELSSGEVELGEQVTGADATPDGRWVALRSYAGLSVYRAAELLRPGPGPALTVDLSSLQEPQGEAVAILDGGRIILSSEGIDGATGTIAVLECGLPEPGPGASLP